MKVLGEEAQSMGKQMFLNLCSWRGVHEHLERKTPIQCTNAHIWDLERW